MIAKLQERMSADQSRFQELQDRLSREAADLTTRVGALHALEGKLYEQESHQAKERQKKLEDLIERAEKQGLAKPLP